MANILIGHQFCMCSSRIDTRTTLLFLIYINDLPDNLESLAKLFADDTSLFSTVHDPSKSAKLLNDDLQKIPDKFQTSSGSHIFS